MYSLKSNLQHCQDTIPEAGVQIAWSAIFGSELCNREPKPIITDINEVYLVPNGVSVNIPPFLNHGTFTESEARATKAIAKCRILALFLHIYTVMQTSYFSCVHHLSICSSH